MIGKSLDQRMVNSLFEGKKVVSAEYAVSTDIYNLTFDDGGTRQVTGLFIKEFKGEFYEKV